MLKRREDAEIGQVKRSGQGERERGGGGGGGGGMQQGERA